MTAATSPVVAGEPTDATVAADPAELFFDLAFVFALARLVGFLHDELSATSVVQALVVFALLWWAWSQFTWAANAVGGSRRGVRLVMLAATIATVPLGAALPVAYAEGGLVVAVSWTTLVLAGLAVYLVGVRHDAEHRHAVRAFGGRSLPGVVLVLVGAAITSPTGRLAVWALGFVGLVVAAALAAGEGFRIVPSHFAERHGLFVIVALGETVVALGLGVAGRATDPGVVASLVAGGALATLLWWAYFDGPAPVAEARLHRAAGSDRGPVARDLYTYLHLPVTAGIVLVAVALEEVVAHPEDALVLELRLLLAAGLVLFLGGLVAVVARASHRVHPERPVALGLAVVIVLVAADVSGLVVVLALDAVLLALLAVEHRRG